MRLLVWMLGVMCTLEALMTALHVAPRWVWVFWVFLGVWMLAGVLVLVLAVLRGVAARPGPPAPWRPAPRAAAPAAKNEEG